MFNSKKKKAMNEKEIKEIIKNMSPSERKAFIKIMEKEQVEREYDMMAYFEAFMDD
ncbi:MAG: hypothetical protein IJ167_09485 [Lachnospiraceae bacterium]|nr:hypothetical protein [Lachnospiraceae bacterium]